MVARADGRLAHQLRPASIEPWPNQYAEGSALIRCGGTQVLCTATVEAGVPRFMQGSGRGWVTAEYAMLPRATSSRSQRESAAGKLKGRTQEIQRLIGRSLRAAVNAERLGDYTVVVDCDVLQADGGTRTASITGGYVALALAVQTLHPDTYQDILTPVAAVSVGLVNGAPLLDLEYSEDSAADTDLNVVWTGAGGYVEVQGTAERAPLRREMLDAMLDLAGSGIDSLMKLQAECLAAAGPGPTGAPIYGTAPS